MSTTQGLRIHRKERKISCVLHQSHNHTIISSEGDWKLEKTIELLNYGGLRPCLCTPCGWPDDGSFSSNLPVSHTNCVLSRISSTQTTFLNNHVISGNHQSPPPSHVMIRLFKSSLDVQH